MDFLILKPSSLGDVLHAFPAVNALLKANPDSCADWLINPAFAELLAFLPGVRDAILFERKKLGSFRTFPSSFLALTRSLRRRRYDAVIDLQGLARSAFIGRLASGDLYAGPRDPREKIAGICYSRRLDRGGKQHAVLRNNAMIADFLNRRDLDFSYTIPIVRRFAEKADSLLAPFAAGKTLCAVAPGARWITKQWPPEFFAEILKHLAEKQRNMHFLVLGGPEDSSLSARILSHAHGLPVTDLCGKTSVGTLVEVIRRTQLFICNDSGPMHIAAALGVPVLAMFGPTDPVLTGPYSEKSEILQPSLPCISCFKRYCTDEKCHSETDPAEAACRADRLFRKYYSGK